MGMGMKVMKAVGEGDTADGNGDSGDGEGVG